MGMGRTNHKRNPAQDNLELRREETRSGLEAALRKVGTVAGFAGILMAGQAFRADSQNLTLASNNTPPRIEAVTNREASKAATATNINSRTIIRPNYDTQMWMSVGKFMGTEPATKMSLEFTAHKEDTIDAKGNVNVVVHLLNVFTLDKKGNPQLHQIGLSPNIEALGRSGLSAEERDGLSFNVVYQGFNKDKITVFPCTGGSGIEKKRDAKEGERGARGLVSKTKEGDRIRLSAVISAEIDTIFLLYENLDNKDDKIFIGYEANGAKAFAATSNKAQAEGGFFTGGMNEIYTTSSAPSPVPQFSQTTYMLRMPPAKVYIGIDEVRVNAGMGSVMGANVISQHTLSPVDYNKGTDVSYSKMLRVSVRGGTFTVYTGKADSSANQADTPETGQNQNPK